MARNILVHSHSIPLCDPAAPSDSFVELRLTEAEYRERAETTERSRQAAERMWRDEVQANGGSDRAADVPRYPHPGAPELVKSLVSVEQGWRDIPSDRLRSYVTSGLPPQDLSAEQLAAYRRTAQAVMDHAKDNTEMRKLMATVPPHRLADFTAMMDKMHQPANVEGLAALEWLKDQMRELKVRRELREKVDFQFGRKCGLQNVWPAGRWAEAVALRNGFCKTVLELQQHAPRVEPAQDQPSSKPNPQASP